MRTTITIEHEAPLEHVAVEFANEDDGTVEVAEAREKANSSDLARIDRNAEDDIPALGGE